MARERRVGLDTSVVLNFLVDLDSELEGQRRRHSASVFEAAADGKHQLIVPALVLAEIAGNGLTRGSNLPPAVRQERVDAVIDWMHAEEFTIVDIDGLVARSAAQLAIDHQVKGADASIVAACRQAGCHVLYTWDNGILKLDRQLPGMRVMQPLSGQRQTEMDFSA